MIRLKVCQVSFLTTCNETKNQHIRKTGKFTNTWKLNSVLLNNQLVKEEITSEIKKIPWDKRKLKHNIAKLKGFSKISTKQGVYSTNIYNEDLRLIT